MNDMTQTGVAMALIALASTAFGLLASTIRDRDKLKYDSRVQNLEANSTLKATQILHLTQQNEAQAKEMAELKADHERCQAEHRSTTQRLDQLVAAISAMPGGGTALRRALPPDQTTDDTGDHPAAK